MPPLMIETDEGFAPFAMDFWYESIMRR